MVIAHLRLEQCAYDAASLRSGQIYYFVSLSTSRDKSDGLCSTRRIAVSDKPNERASLIATRSSTERCAYLPVFPFLVPADLCMPVGCGPRFTAGAPDLLALRGA